MLVSCAPAVLVPNPPAKQSDAPAKPPDAARQSAARPSRESSDQVNELDFAIALVDTEEIASEPIDTIAAAGHASGAAPVNITTGGKIRMTRSTIRVAIFPDVSRIVVYSVGKVKVVDGARKKQPVTRGRIEIQASSRTDGEAIVNHKAFSLPCTLVSKDSYNFFEIQRLSYRGGIIIDRASSNRLHVINCLAVEAYLRGVVPHEMGPRPIEEIEALKAQAIAARTYAYRKMLARETAAYDVVATVADQVYRGVNSENRISDRAIRQTRGLVMVYGGQLIHGYYHSTCGGKTANIEDAWKKTPAPYLVSRDDVDESGRAWCSISKYYIWDESWRTRQLSTFINRFSRESGVPIEGSLLGMKIALRYQCGRIGALQVRTTKGDYTLSGDKIRFVLRRNHQDYPILRSANFDIVSTGSSTISITGRGYGHGVGMCQMGAIGRARAGQTCTDILKAYYTGIDIAPVAAGDATNVSRQSVKRR
ncbi:MAG: SpoIID/LytB domain-containing protein [Chitinivibrionales bacterium]|nr:SpoIID/LytB domain-containing protein [Chitinivibrionales bacterium]